MQTCMRADLALCTDARTHTHTHKQTHTHTHTHTQYLHEGGLGVVYGAREYRGLEGVEVVEFARVYLVQQH